MILALISAFLSRRHVDMWLPFDFFDTRGEVKHICPHS